MTDRFDDIRADAACCAREYDTDKEKDSSLTDDWKAGKLKAGWYFTLTTMGEVFPNLWFDDEWNDFMGLVEEVLAPCDYDELKRLKEENNTLSALVTGNELENEQLRNLLKECKEFLENDGFDVYSWSKFAETEDTLLTRIDAALGEEE